MNLNVLTINDAAKIAQAVIDSDQTGTAIALGRDD